MSHLIRKIVAWASAIGVAFAGGCAQYRPRPLTPAAVERALTAPPPETLRARAAALNNPLLPPAVIGAPGGLTPDAAAVLAVLINPSLRATRARLQLADAQLVQARILPNPQLDMTLDPVTGGNTANTVPGYLFGLSWDVTALISRGARVAAARAQQASVRLDVAWQEWQVAQAARKAVYDQLALRAQAVTAQAIDRGLGEEADVVRRAVNAHQKTLLDLAAAETASQKAHTDLLTIEGNLRHQELALNQAVGSTAVEPLPLQSMRLPARLHLPSREQLLNGLEDRRLDLVALRRGYAAQEQTVRAAVLSQFPKLVLNVHHASDTSNVHTTGPGITLDLPIFDRNQANIGIEEATRQRLFDEYVARVFDARTIVAITLADIESVTEQIANAEASLPALRRLVDAYRAAVGQGNVDVLSYYTAQGDLATRQLDVLRLKQQLLADKVALEIAAGTYLPDDEAPASAATRPATQPALTPTTKEVTTP